MAIDFGSMEEAGGQSIRFVWRWYDLGLVLCFAHVKISLSVDEICVR